LEYVELIFLGTGGGRFSIITQKRKTGGIRINVNGFHMHLDPGPGALVYSLQNKLSPQKLRVVLVSHAHPDHYNDAEVLIEGMSFGATKKKGTLIASRSVLSGNDVCGPAISNYHKRVPEKVFETKPGDSVNLEKLKVYATRAVHTDPDTIGFKFDFGKVGVVGYTSDTEYFEGVGREYEGVRLLILCVMRPYGHPWKGHMTTEDAIKIVSEVDPEVALITHFGMKMIMSNPLREAKIIERETGVKTVAAIDGMRVFIGEEIRFRKATKKGLEEFLS